MDFQNIKSKYDLNCKVDIYTTKKPSAKGGPHYPACWVIRPK